MLKLAATLMLILGGAGTGYARSRELTEREKNLEILLQILFFLKGEIRSGNSPLPHAFREIAGKIEGSFSKILLLIFSNEYSSPNALSTLIFLLYGSLLTLNLSAL